MMRLFLLLILLLLSEDLLAGFDEGNKLYEHCVTAQDDFSNGVCIGYINGISLTISAIEQATKTNTVCITENATQRSIRDIVVNYMKTHPEKRHLYLYELIISSLKEAYCDNK